MNNSLIKKLSIYFLIVLVIFSFDRISKVLILNILEDKDKVDIYINSFLNFYLVWNTGVGFGLISLESNIYYHILTIIIVLVNMVLIYFLVKSKGKHAYLFSFIVGGALGNLFDRVYYYAVPDFFDLHIQDFHWFIFNIADIFISVGIIGLILVELIKKEKTSKNA